MTIIPCILDTFMYGEKPAPAVWAAFFVPGKTEKRPVKFLIDTGADMTCLHGPNARRIRNVLQDSETIESSGIGGECEYFVEKAVIVFQDIEGNPYPVTLEIGIQKGDNFYSSMILPNIIGRDILNRGELHYRPLENTVNLVFP